MIILNVGFNLMRIGSNTKSRQFPRMVDLAQGFLSFSQMLPLSEDPAESRSPLTHPKPLLTRGPCCSWKFVWSVPRSYGGIFPRGPHGGDDVGTCYCTGGSLR